VPLAIDSANLHVTIEFDSGPLAGMLRAETPLELPAATSAK
jgi:hypothetical protein